MSQLVLHRRLRLAGIRELIGLVRHFNPPRKASPALPTSARLRRDIGLVEHDPVASLHAGLPRKL